MASETSEVKVEDQSNNNNSAAVVDDSLKTKMDRQEADDQIELQTDPGNNSSDIDAKDANNGVTVGEEEEKDEDVNDQMDDDQDGEGDDDTAGAANDESMDDSEKTNLIVNYLPQQMTDEEFKQLFDKFGAMKSCKIVRNRMTGYSYGFGFVDFETHDQAVKAIEELNGHELDTKKIKVAFARPAGQDIKQANLYVKNIPLSWTQDDVRKAFESYGNIIQVRVLGNNRGVAFVLYDLRKQAELALEAMQGKKLDGAEEPLDIKFAADKKSEKKRSGRRGRGGGGGGGGGAATNNNSNPTEGNPSGRTRERGNRGGVNRNRNRSQSDNRNRMQHGGPRSSSNQRGGRPNNSFNNNNNSNSNTSGNQMNNGFGPIRQQQSGRVTRFAPFAPVQHQAPLQPAAPLAPYGYPQAMYPYMMQQQQQPAMMQFNSTATAAVTQPMAAAAAAMNPMGPYQMAAGAATSQMAPMAYGAPQQATSNMYTMASNTMQNAAQLQPQLGQPMSNQANRGAQQQQSGSAGSGGAGSSSDGVTLFVYNIGPQSDETELRSMFAPYGQVLRCNVVRKTPGGETKGFGFVTLKDKSQANAAIASLNGSPRNGKTLQVSLKK